MMRRIKKILFTFVVVILILPSFLVTASTNDSKRAKISSDKIGEVSSKDEVVYAMLSATGNQQNIYVVNTLEVEKAGKIVDYGFYSSLKNLSDLSKIKQLEDKVQFTAPEGKFFYQGNMSNVPLPWDIAISYFLDGKEISPAELAGKDGHVQIQIATSINKKVRPVFVENYLLQISLPLDFSIFSNIRAQDGTITSVGKDKQVTYTVMPENEEVFLLEADVVDFVLDGIDIIGVPLSMAIDAPDVDEMTSDMKTLSDAIAEFNDAVSKLKSGVSELNNGAVNLQSGSKQYKNGIADLASASPALVNGSLEISNALKTLHQSLGNIEGMDFSGLNQFGKGLTRIANGLTETADGLAILKENYSIAYDVLNTTMATIPANDITEEEIKSLYESGANQKVVGKLVETYTATQTAKITYSEVKSGFDAVGITLDGAIHALTKMAKNLDTMAKRLSSSLENIDGMDRFVQFQEGIATLSANYQAFHSGLATYTNGVGQLADSYAGLHDGIAELSGGTEGLNNGVKQLHDGTTELHELTSDLPEQMQAEIDQMMSNYDKSDFEAESFVSEKNENVNSVQFVLKTESINYEKPKRVDEPEQEEKGFWARLLNLFR